MQDQGSMVVARVQKCHKLVQNMPLIRAMGKCLHINVIADWASITWDLGFILTWIMQIIAFGPQNFQGTGHYGLMIYLFY